MEAAITYQPVARVSSVDAVVGMLRTDILRGRWEPGSKLPPERELAAALGVNRLTLRTALSRLIAAKLIEARHGEGNRVLDFRLHSGLERLPELAEAFHGDPVAVAKSVADLLALRRCVLTEAVAQAVTGVTPDDIARLEDLLAEQRARRGEIDAFMAGDIAFTRAVLHIADNLAYELVFNTVIQFGRDHGDILRCMFSDPAMICRGYEGMIALLRDGDPENARQLVRTALEYQDREHTERIRSYLAEER